MKLEGKQIGVLIALVLGVVILFLPAQEGGKYRFDPAEIAGGIKDGGDRIDPETLSGWLIEGRRDFLLVDIRSADEYERGHIRGAENIPLEELLKKETLEGLPSDKLIVLYSNGVSHASQAWLVMKAAGYDSYMLSGGYNYWARVILSPAPPSADAADDEVLRYRARLAVSNHFGGPGGQGATSMVRAGAEPKKKKTIIRRPKKKKKLKGC